MAFVVTFVVGSFIFVGNWFVIAWLERRAERRSRNALARVLLGEALDWGVGASNRYPYLEHAMLCDSTTRPGAGEREPVCDCGLAEWLGSAERAFDRRDA